VKLPGPLVIGALGGSGTRVVAQALIESGLHLGSDLNQALDNLWFTLLFKRPVWYAEVVEAQPGEIAVGFDILTKAMAGTPQLSAAERAFIRKAMLQMAMRGHDHDHSGRGIWPIVRAQRLRAGAPPPAGSVGWGWKEPNSHILLPQLIEHFTELKFVYVVRHGLDMAYSDNRAQLYNWGARLGVELPATEASLPDAMLAYWVAATDRAIELGAALGSRFLRLDYEALCAEPRTVLPQLLEFAGVTVDDARLAKLAALPRSPRSIGRYRAQRWQELNADNIEAVRRLGFAID